METNNIQKINDKDNDKDKDKDNHINNIDKKEEDDILHSIRDTKKYNKNNLINSILQEINSINYDNNEMQNNIDNNNSKKRKLEKILYNKCEHEFVFSYRIPHDSAVYQCKKCNCYDDQYYY